MNSTIIKAQRLRIVVFSEQYLTEKYVSWLNDKETMKYSDQRFLQHTITTCKKYWKSFEGTSHQFWAIVLKDKKETHIGNITTYIDLINDVTDISILIGERSLWGKGYGSEAWQTMCDYLLIKKKVRKVTAGTISANKGMLRLMKKSGMVEDGRRKHHCIYEQKEVDVIHSALFQKDVEHTED